MFLLKDDFILFWLMTVTTITVINATYSFYPTIHYFPAYNDECILDCNEGYCTTAQGYRRHCSVDPYTTSTGEKCSSACLPYSNYYYCYTSNGNWGYCTLYRKRPRKIHFGAQNQSPCLTSCDSFSGESYSWCRTSLDNHWEYCSRREMETFLGTKCSNYINCDTLTPQEGYNWCFTDDHRSHYCGVIQDISISIQVEVLNLAPYPYMDYRVRYSSDARQVETIDTFFIANKTGTSIRRFPRRIESQGVCENYEFQGQNVGTFLEGIFNDFELQARTGMNGIRSMATNWSDTNSIMTAYVRDVAGPPQVEAVGAMIYANHLRQSINRADFTYSQKQHMRRRLGARVGEDEAGHVVASSLGGPSELYNLVPQHQTVNRRVGNGGLWANDWYSVEERMRQFFYPGQPGDSGGHVMWRVFVFYNSLNDVRPSHFLYYASFWDGNGEEINNSVWYPLPGICSNEAVTNVSICNAGLSRNLPPW